MLKEQEASKTILAIFRAIEERDAAQFRALLQPDFEIHWPRSLPYRGKFRGVEPQPHGWGRNLAAFAAYEAERMMDKSLPHTTMMLSSCGTNVGGSGDGESIDEEVPGLYRFHDGLARAQMFYFDALSVAHFLAKNTILKKTQH